MDIATLRSLIEYNPETGLMTWRARPVHAFKGANPKAAANAWNARYSGKPALNAPNGRGYLTGCIFTVRLAAHRAAWALHYGEWPNGQLDHINGKRDDNRISNLREVTAAQNQYNAAQKSADLQASKRGAHFHKRKKRWAASIRVHLGYFDSEEEAAAAYEKAAKELHGGYYLPNGVRAP